MVHGFLSLHTTVGVYTHPTVRLQLSLVQRLRSSQVIGTYLHPDAGRHESLVQAFPSSHAMGA